MTEELRHEHEHEHHHEHECFCHSKGFRKFLIVALGSFVGVFCALSLFCALHKPPMPYGPYGAPMFAPHNCNCAHHKMINKKDGERKEFKHKKDFKEFAKEAKEEIKD